jgi:hypothetical protein
MLVVARHACDEAGGGGATAVGSTAAGRSACALSLVETPELGICEAPIVSSDGSVAIAWNCAVA